MVDILARSRTERFEKVYICPPPVDSVADMQTDILVSPVPCGFQGTMQQPAGESLFRLNAVLQSAAG